MTEHKPVGGGMGATLCSCGEIVPTRGFDLHAGILGYMVLEKRARPDGGFDYDYVRMRDGTPAAIATLEGAQNVLESRQGKQARDRRTDLDPVEYVIAQINERTP